MKKSLVLSLLLSSIFIPELALGKQQDGSIDPNQYPAFAKFMKEHRCPADIENRDVVWKEGNIGRAINATRLRNAIRTNKLGDNLAVPKKCLMWKEGSWKVAAEKIHAERRTDLITLKEIQALTKIVEETGFRDCVGNIGFQNKKLWFIDTEDDSFLLGPVHGGEDYPPHCKALYVGNLQVYLSSMNPEAQNWFQEKLSALITSEEGVARDTPLPMATKYDPSGIDFNKVREEFHKYNENN